MAPQLWAEQLAAAPGASRWPTSRSCGWPARSASAACSWPTPHRPARHRVGGRDTASDGRTPILSWVDSVGTVDSHASAPWKPRKPGPSGRARGARRRWRPHRGPRRGRGAGRGPRPSPRQPAPAAGGRRGLRGRAGARPRRRRRSPPSAATSARWPSCTSGCSPSSLYEVRRRDRHRRRQRLLRRRRRRPRRPRRPAPSGRSGGLRAGPRGAYLIHDDGFYRGISPLARARRRRRSTSAMHGWARVVSQPEPGLALLDAGKRDLRSTRGCPSRS